MKRTFMILFTGLFALPAYSGLEYREIDGCRVLDTRIWQQSLSDPIPSSRAVELDLSNGNGNLNAQGGSVGGCPDIPDDAAAFSVTISPIAPGFPSTPFSGVGFATMLPFDFGSWTPAGFTSGGNQLYTFDTPPFNESASVLFDSGTDITTNTTIVKACQTCTHHARLYTSGSSHFAVDVVGYFLPQPVEFHEYFFNTQPALTQCPAWLSFKNSIDAGSYTEVTISGDLDDPGLSCTDPVVVNGLADAIANDTDYEASCDGHQWSHCARSGGEVWIDPPSLCAGGNCPNQGRIVRPCIGDTNANWGGLNTATCSSNPDQRMSVRFH